MLKEQLLEEAKTIEVSVELDPIFESVDISDKVKEQFKTVFEAAVKNQSLKLAESHINAIAEKADAKVEELVEAKTEQAEKEFTKRADTFFEHLAKEWLTENKLEVDRGIKADLFESMFVGLKSLFVEHNVVLPEESVDVVAEMEEELTEAKELASSLFEQKQEVKNQFDSFKREIAIKESTKDLTESQKEKVSTLIEGLDYSDNFEEKLKSIVEFASSKTKIETKPLTEGTVEVENLNFVVETQKNDNIDPMMAQYIKSAKVF